MPSWLGRAEPNLISGLVALNPKSAVIQRDSAGGVVEKDVESGLSPGLKASPCKGCLSVKGTSLDTPGSGINKCKDVHAVTLSIVCV